MRDRDLEIPAPHLRFGLRACLAGMLLGDALAISLKRAGLMPPHISWLGVSLVPAAPFILLGSLFAGPLLLGRHWRWLFLPVASACCLAMLAVIVFERG